ncbi:hypothetical protein Q6D67_21190 [Haliea sp. E1-2-M8]|uniref:hypothetical protein n=1 Tax=Haliea sp. E1-2-M8 TaxID=3064706 RepID=UPI00271BD596|nr:hypothetical protein [Haliea sp. E1-2-M8]MDO8864196.1 hypothetical protein [Haliea sp. E1-2-M8]
MDESQIMKKLARVDSELRFISPSGNFKLVYKARCNVDRSEMWRTYELQDLERGGNISDPWGPFDAEKQATLVSNIIAYSGYRLEAEIDGWKMSCPNCGYSTTGGYHELKPTKCPGCKTEKRETLSFVERHSQD